VSACCAPSCTVVTCCSLLLATLYGCSKQAFGCDVALLLTGARTCCVPPAAVSVHICCVFGRGHLFSLTKTVLTTNKAQQCATCMPDVDFIQRHQDRCGNSLCLHALTYLARVPPCYLFGTGCQPSLCVCNSDPKELQHMICRP
jgi:hypothetical protein